jgi:DNA polymerase V
MLLVGHLDADCYYASAERVRFRFLRNQPVGVLGNQGACVIAKSYEMKARGVKTGEPIWEARRKCPEGIYIKRDFRWYEVISRAMLAAVRTLSPKVEFYSIDEFFFEAQPSPGQSPQRLAEEIRDHVWKAVGVPVTVGIARTRTLAKLISDSAKPFGALAVLDRDAAFSFLSQRSVTDISGIAARRARRLEPHGILTALDFALADRKLIREQLTIVGEQLWWELRGESVLPIQSERPAHKMLSRGGSLGEKVIDPDRLVAWLARNSERLVEELEHYALFAGRLEVYLGHPDRRGVAARVDLPQPTNRFDRLMEAGRNCLRRAWDHAHPVNRMHLFATRLCRPGFVQQGLFETPEENGALIARVKRAVNAKLGRFAVRSGATLPLYEVYRDSAQSYDICDVRGKVCF